MIDIMRKIKGGGGQGTVPSVEPPTQGQPGDRPVTLKQLNYTQHCLLSSIVRCLSQVDIHLDKALEVRDLLDLPGGYDEATSVKAIQFGPVDAKSLMGVLGRFGSLVTQHVLYCLATLEIPEKLQGYPLKPELLPLPPLPLFPQLVANRSLMGLVGVSRPPRPAPSDPADPKVDPALLDRIDKLINAQKDPGPTHPPGDHPGAPPDPTHPPGDHPGASPDPRIDIVLMQLQVMLRYTQDSYGHLHDELTRMASQVSDLGGQQ